MNQRVVAPVKTPHSCLATKSRRDRVQVVPNRTISERIFGSHECAAEMSGFYLRRSRLFSAAAALVGLVLTGGDLLQLLRAGAAIPLERIVGNGIFVVASLAAAWVCHLLIPVGKWWTGPLVGAFFIAIALVQGIVLLTLPTTLNSPQVYLVIILLATAGGIPLPPPLFHPLALISSTLGALLLLVSPEQTSDARLWAVLLASVFVISVAIDTSTFRTLRSEVLSKQRREASLRLLAHDLRNPIAQMPRLASMLVHDSTSKVERTEFARILETTASGTFNMLENLLQWEKSRSEGAVQLESLAVDRVLSEVLPFQQAYAQSKDIRLLIDAEPDLSFLGDAVAVATVLRNTIGNAVKFSQEGSVVQITVAPAAARQYVQFEVSDSGVGASTEKLSAIRSGRPMPGSRGTRSEPGTGLGLAVCARLLAKLDSTLEIESEPGHGTVVRFRLHRV
ncbi:MAG: sensor histidine kinase [Spirochaetales bacterium]